MQKFVSKRLDMFVVMTLH